MADSTDYTQWLKRANQDLRLVEVIKEEGFEGLEDSFCYICHQGAEKLLKAFIIKYEKTAPKSHDLLFLLRKCVRYNNSLVKLADPLTVLNEYSISARYPGDFEDKRTLEEAIEVYNCISEVKNVIAIVMLNDFKISGRG